MKVELGQAVPPLTSHAISVSLPFWSDNVGYEEGEKRVLDKMVNGYPRFYCLRLPFSKLSQICETKFAKPDERCMLFPTQKTADLCRQFIRAKSDSLARLVHLFVHPEDSSLQDACVDLHIVLFPASATGIAKQFWQHTGLGISSRLADHCLNLMNSNSPLSTTSSSSTGTYHKRVGPGNRHYTSVPKGAPSAIGDEDLNSDQSVYLEERYGRNLPLSYGASAKRALRRRIAMVLEHDPHSSVGVSCVPLGPSVSDAGHVDALVGPSARGVKEVTEDDVFLYPTGMAAIWSAHDIIRHVRPEGKSVCFGFPYTDTLKILEKWGPGCHFLGNGLDSDIPALEEILVKARQENPSKPPILALFTEFPSNPLLRTADLEQLRQLADKYDFLIVVDETLGNFMNVEVLPFADIVVSSLTKIFSGDANAMGGSLVLNPHSKYYSALKGYLTNTYEDIYFSQDAIFMERNSRDFQKRIVIIDANTEAICDWLYERSLAGGTSNGVIREVFYPKYVTPHNYEARRVKDRDTKDGRGAGYGGLFSITFTTTNAAKAFYDNLDVFKGPSLGTNFTLACPYTILAHYTELDWARQWGVDPGLVRVSVGMEALKGEDGLLPKFASALKAAEAAIANN